MNKKQETSANPLFCKKRLVVNLDEDCIKLDEVSKRVLEKGLNYNITQKSLPRDSVISAVEDTARSMSTTDQVNFRANIMSVLKKWKPSKPNMSKDEWTALNNLKKDTSITILPADKGRCVVVMTRNHYEEKMNTLLGSSEYVVCKKNPTETVSKKVSRILNDLQNKGYITNKLRLNLVSGGHMTPRIYGLPKIHKENAPLRPIVSFMNSPTYKLAQFLAEQLRNLVGQTEFHVKNSSDFAHFAQKVEIKKDSILVSFDVVSLFTKVPVPKALEHLQALLRSNSQLTERIGIPVNDIIELVKLCMNSTFFNFKEKTYQQKEGAPMGSPLSPFIADLFMEKLESEILLSTSKRPRIWKRYVDDTFCIWDNSLSELEDFLNLLNSYDEHIKFTMEIEKNGQLSFLDVMCIKKNLKISTKVYRKPTATYRLIDMNSAHIATHKFSVIDTLVKRALKVCSDEHLEDELRLLRKIFQANGYPKKIVETKINEHRNRTTRPPNNTNRPEPRKRNTLVIPYDECLVRLLQPSRRALGLKIITKPINKLKGILVKPKDKLQTEKQCNIIYEIPCTDGKSYIGETCRPLKTRLHEHKEAIRKLDIQKSALAEHIATSNARPCWENVKILAHESHWYKRRLKEALWIERKSTINRNHGLENISKIWKQNDS